MNEHKCAGLLIVVPGILVVCASNYDFALSHYVDAERKQAEERKFIHYIIGEHFLSLFLMPLQYADKKILLKGLKFFHYDLVCLSRVN